jgi:hypothetical protein
MISTTDWIRSMSVNQILDAMVNQEVSIKDIKEWRLHPSAIDALLFHAEGQRLYDVDGLGNRFEYFGRPVVEDAQQAMRPSPYEVVSAATKNAS